MDPLSLTASIIAVGGAAATVAKQLNHLRTTLRDVPDDLCSVVNEISDLQLVLETCKSVVESSVGSGVDLSAATAKINILLGKSEQHLQELGQLVSSCLSPSSSGGGIQRVRIAKLRWLKASNHINKLRTQLRASKQDIQMLLEANNGIVISGMELCLQTISSGLFGAQQFQVDTSKKLDDVLARLNEQAVRTEQLTTRNDNAISCVGRARKSAVKEIVSPDLLLNDTSESHLLGYKTQPISVFALCYHKTCWSWCSCCCHIKRRIRSPSSGILKTLVGSLFVGYSGIPAMTPSCNETQCRKRSSMRIMLNYQFPEWLWTKMLFASYDTSTLAGPELLLRVQTKIPFASPALDYCFRGDITSLKRMFEDGTASPFDVDPDGTSLLLRALLLNSKPNLWHFLISYGADIHQEDCTGQSASRYASDWILEEPASGPRSVLLDFFPQAEDSLDDRQFSRIHKCVLGFSSYDLVSELTISTSSINDVDDLGRTPLWWAARRGDSDAVLTLLQFNADPNRRGHQRALTGVSILPLQAAAASGKASVVHHLISHASVDINQRGTHGCTPLHFAACQTRGTQCIEMLLSAGADVDARNDRGWDALLLATVWSNLENAEVLLKYGADIDATNNSGGTALGTCMCQQKHDSVLWLLHNGARYDFTIHDQTLLHLAAWCADLSMLQILCDADLRGLKIDAEDNNGWTAKEVADTWVEQSQEWHDTFEKLILMAGRKEEMIADGNDVYEDDSLILRDSKVLRVNYEVSMDDSDSDEVFYDASEEPKSS
ncbi:ankyrin [Viridothelium virens]|uniref:Ankyrin n=1 Tax=Viridothelium virens TaxID=1048519 RepID=A0A6A6H579_VIRVR|nr:ankyrin [Viridothelium virens]